MSAPRSTTEPVDRRYVRHSPDYLASQQWTADRVRRELVHEAHPAPRYEFIDGELLVSPSPEFRHQAIVSRLLVLLDAYVRAERLGVALVSPSDVALAPDSTAQPDVFVVPADEVRRVRAVRGHEPVRRLLLACEVLSPSTIRTDRLRKRRFYARAGVAEYWVVDPDARVLERTVAGDERVTLEDERVVWHPTGAVAAFTLDVPAFFADALGDEEPGNLSSGGDRPGM